VEVEEEERSVSGQADFLALARLESAWGALSGMRLVGQNNAGSWPLHQTKLARPGADNMVLGDGISPSRDLLQGLASCDRAAHQATPLPIGATG